MSYRPTRHQQARKAPAWDYPQREDYETEAAWVADCALWEDEWERLNPDRDAAVTQAQHNANPNYCGRHVPGTCTGQGTDCTGVKPFTPAHKNESADQDGYTSPQTWDDNGTYLAN